MKGLRTLPWVLFIFSTNICWHCFGLISIVPPAEKDIHQVEITLTNKPANEKEAPQWQNDISLVKTGLPAYINAWTKKRNNTFVDQILRALDRLKGKKQEKTSRKQSHLFYLQTSPVDGHFVFHIPDGITFETISQEIKKWCDQNSIQAEISTVVPVRIHHQPIPKSIIGLEGKYLSLEELENLKKGTLIPQLQYQLNKVIKNNGKSEKDNAQIQSLKDRIEDLKEMKKVLFWHQEIPTTGLRASSQFFPPAYPFLPHLFLLWDLAPKKGAGIRVGIIDTGIAAFSLKDNPSYLKNQDLQITDNINFLYDNCNLVSENGMNALEQLIYTIAEYVRPNQFDLGELEKTVPLWIYDYLTTKKTTRIISYLKSKGKKGLFESNGYMTKLGNEAISAITEGPDGICPKNQTTCFSLTSLIEPPKQVVFQLLPTAIITSEEMTFVSGHGSHTSGIAAGKLQGKGTINSPINDTGICGIAPQAELIMIKAFQSDGSSDTTTLIAAAKKALQYDVDVANLSLKIADRLNLQKESSKLLQSFLGLIPYVVAASGNDGSPQYAAEYPGVVESYPAKFDDVEFDVGAFGYHEGGLFPISLFSQYEPNVGPKFVAPGFNILSSALVPGQKISSEYVFMDGTSMATPVMTGFVALMLGEFKADFTREEFLKVCYKSAIKYHNDQDWNKKVLLGALDMRTALFTLHAIKSVRQQLGMEKKTIPFDNILEAVQTVIFGLVDEYARVNLAGQDFRNDFSAFFDSAQKNKKLFNSKTFFDMVGGKTLDNAIEFVQKIIFYALDPTQIKKKPRISADLLQKVQTVLANKNLDVFGFLPPNIRNRLIKTETVDLYWEQQARKLKELSTKKIHDEHGILSKLDEKTRSEIMKVEQQIEVFKEAAA